MQVLSFTANYNNKLNGDFFTAILAVKKFSVKESIIIEYNNSFRFATVLQKKQVLLTQLSDWHTYLDRGVDKNTYIENINMWYSKEIDITTTPLFYYLIKNTSSWRNMAQFNNPLKP